MIVNHLPDLRICRVGFVTIQPQSAYLRVNAIVVDELERHYLLPLLHEFDLFPLYFGIHAEPVKVSRQVKDLEELAYNPRILGVEGLYRDGLNESLLLSGICGYNAGFYLYPIYVHEGAAQFRKFPVPIDALHGMHAFVQPILGDHLEHLARPKLVRLLVMEHLGPEVLLGTSRKHLLAPQCVHSRLVLADGAAEHAAVVLKILKNVGAPDMHFVWQLLARRHEDGLRDGTAAPWLDFINLPRVVDNRVLVDAARVY